MLHASNEVYVGRYFGQHDYDVTADAVRHYCESVAEDESLFTERSPYDAPVAPPLMFHSDVYAYNGWYLPHIYGNLHARQEWQFFAPIMVGEKVTTNSVVVDRYEKRDREYVVNEVNQFAEDGRPVLRGRTHQSFLIDKGRRDTVVDKSREKRSDRRFDVGDGEVIEELAGPKKEITLEMCQEFSGPAKNYHNDVEAARALGFPDIVVQGMMPLCFVADMLAERFGSGLYVGGRMDIKLVNVLWQGETVRARGVVQELLNEGEAQRAQLQVWCEKDDGTKVVVGSASALVP
ncbi:MAG: MaoC family dehydratase N-terminal domain-containing protein [Dehalococcoidia bacterium]